MPIPSDRVRTGRIIAISPTSLPRRTGPNRPAEAIEQQAAEQVAVVQVTRRPAIVSAVGQQRGDPVPQVKFDDRSVLAGVMSIAVPNLADVDPIAE